MEVHDEWTDVPRVSAFYGIVISMYFREDIHPGRPHFHAAHAENEATFDIESLEVIVGRFPRREKNLVRKWARLHQDALRSNWARLRSHGSLIPIEPLR